MTAIAYLVRDQVTAIFLIYGTGRYLRLSLLSRPEFALPRGRIIESIDSGASAYTLKRNIQK